MKKVILILLIFVVFILFLSGTVNAGCQDNPGLNCGGLDKNTCSSLGAVCAIHASPTDTNCRSYGFCGSSPCCNGQCVNNYNSCSEILNPEYCISMIGCDWVGSTDFWDSIPPKIDLKEYVEGSVYRGFSFTLDDDSEVYDCGYEVAWMPSSINAVQPLEDPIVTSYNLNPSTLDPDFGTTYFPLATKLLYDGSYFNVQTEDFVFKLTLKCEDIRNNVASKTISFIIYALDDNTIPDVSISSPSDGGVYNTLSEFTFTATDNALESYGCDYRINGGNTIPIMSAVTSGIPETYAFNPPEGFGTSLRVICSDTQGNMGFDEVIFDIPCTLSSTCNAENTAVIATFSDCSTETYTCLNGRVCDTDECVDKQLPVVDISFPEVKTYNAGEVTSFTFTGTDNIELSTCQYRLNANPWGSAGSITAGSTSVTKTISISPTVGASTSVSVRCTDTSSNTGADSVNFGVTEAACANHDQFPSDYDGTCCEYDSTEPTKKLFKETGFGYTKCCKSGYFVDATGSCKGANTCYDNPCTYKYSDDPENYLGSTDCFSISDMRACCEVYNLNEWRFEYKNIVKLSD